MAETYANMSGSVGRSSQPSPHPRMSVACEHDSVAMRTADPVLRRSNCALAEVVNPGMILTFYCYSLCLFLRLLTKRAGLLLNQMIYRKSENFGLYLV